MTIDTTIFATYIDHNADETMARARDLRAHGAGMAWGHDDHTLAEAAADMGAHVHAEIDGQFVCELSDRLFVLGMDDGGPWAVEVADREDLAWVQVHDAEVHVSDGYAHVTITYADGARVETGCYLGEAAHLGGTDIGDDQDCWALDSEDDRGRLAVALETPESRAKIDAAVKVAHAHYTALYADECWGVTTVVDPAGGRWWPSDEAQREIEVSTDPEIAALHICRVDPTRGEWRD